jgi:hypothetical protein
MVYRHSTCAAQHSDDISNEAVSALHTLYQSRDVRRCNRAEKDTTAVNYFNDGAILLLTKAKLQYIANAQSRRCWLRRH